MESAKPSAEAHHGTSFAPTLAERRYKRLIRGWQIAQNGTNHTLAESRPAR
jgi:hypothetical protein